MKLEALRRSVVRLFRKSDTSVPPQIEPARDPEGYKLSFSPGVFSFGYPTMEYVGTPWSPPPSPLVSDPPTPADLDAIGASLLGQLKAAGLLSPDPEVRVHRGRIDPSLKGWDDYRQAPRQADPEPAPSRPGVKPPADPEIDNASWEWWETCRGTQRVPGWAYCRFANRVGDKAQFAFGYVRGSFGIWAKPFRTCTGMHPDVVSAQQVLVTGTHLLTGHAVGLFESMATAAEACELADRVAGEWATEKDTKGLDGAIHRTQQAWAGAGIVPSSTSHAHDEDDLPALILTRSIESVMEGKPERLS